MGHRIVIGLIGKRARGIELSLLFLVSGKRHRIGIDLFRKWVTGIGL